MKHFKFMTIVAAISGSIAVSLETAEQTCSNDLEMQNVEALSYVEFTYDQNCSENGDGCTTAWFVWYPDDKGWG